MALQIMVLSNKMDVMQESYNALEKKTVTKRCKLTWVIVICYRN
jgi:hypothetical protein